MKKSKKVFAAAVVIFGLLLAFASYDIATRTTFPDRGKKGNLPAESNKNDSTSEDSTTIFEKK